MKTAIIGAGICGLYLGKKLKEKGNDVVIFERKKEIGNNVCSGLFSLRILDHIPQSKKLIENRINYVLVHFPRKTIKVSFSKPFLVMSHSELDKLAYSLAKETGVEIILNNEIKAIPEGFDRVIGCDGFDSITRRGLNMPNPKFRIGIQGFLKKENNSDFVEVWPQNEGFIWRIPRGKETEYGIMGKQDIAFKEFKSFLDKNNINLENIKSKLIPQGFLIPYNESITLCGDSAGLTKPWSGGGVIWGLKAADILAECFPNFKKYKSKTEKFFKFKITRSQIMVKLVYFIGFKMPFIMPKRAKIESDFLF